MHTRIGGFAALLLLPAVAIPAQTPSFPTSTERVIVDVVVTDAEGRPLSGLTRDDFLVKEDGAVQTIVDFQAVDVAEASSAEDASSAAGPAPAAPARVATNDRTPAAGRTFVVVFDDLNLSYADADRVRSALHTFLELRLREVDCLTLVPTAGGAWWTGCGSRDRGDLAAALAALRGRRRPDLSRERMSDYEAMRIEADNDAEAAQHVTLRYIAQGLVEELDDGRRSTTGGKQLGAPEGSYPLARAIAADVYAQVRQRSETALRTLERAVQSLAGGRRRHVVVLASSGFVHDHRLPGFQRVREAARRANAALYFVDARGLTDPMVADRGDLPSLPDADNRFRYASLVLEYAAGESTGAEALAADTGGFTVRGSDLAQGLGRINAESRVFYLLGYATSNPGNDRRFRKIEVVVRRPGVKVRARKGYIPGAAPDQASAADAPPARARRALDAVDDAREVPLRMMAYALGNAAGGRITVLLSAEADPAALRLEPRDGGIGGALASFSEVAARDTGELGRKELVHELSLRPEQIRALATTWLPVTHVYELPPGRYQARLAVIDRASGRTGSVRLAFDVPGLQGLRLTTPVLTDVLAPAPAPGAAARPVPVVRRSFAVGRRLLCAVEVWGGGSSKAVEIAYEVRRADGTVVVRTEPRPLAAGARSDVFKLTLNRPGEYELRLRARDPASGEETVADERFSVKAP